MGLSNLSSGFRPGVVANSSQRPSAPYEGQMIYQTDIDQVLVWNGSSWSGLASSNLSTTGTVSSEGAVRANTGHADGGVTMRQWTGSATYTGIATQNMTGSEYMMLSDGTDTFVSGGVGGVTYIRAGNNDTANSVTVSSSGVNLNGVTRLGQAPNPYGWHVANQPVGTEMVIGAFGQNGYGWAAANTWVTIGQVTITVPTGCSVIECIFGFTMFVSSAGPFIVRVMYANGGATAISDFNYYRNTAFDHFTTAGTRGLGVTGGTSGLFWLQVYGSGITLNMDGNDNAYYTVHTI